MHELPIIHIWCFLYCIDIHCDHVFKLQLFITLTGNSLNSDQQGPEFHTTSRETLWVSKGSTLWKPKGLAILGWIRLNPQMSWLHYDINLNDAKDNTGEM